MGYDILTSVETTTVRWRHHADECEKNNQLLRMGVEIDQYHLIISSGEFDDVYPLNTNIKFDIDLPSNLQLNTSWEVALTEVWIRSDDKREQVDLCADFCIESLVNGKFIPILRRIEVKKGYNHVIYSNPLYIHISRADLKHVSFYITHSRGIDLTFIKSELTIQVHFRKRMTSMF